MALSAARNTPARADRLELSLPVKGSTTIYAGSLVVVAAGYAAPGSTAENLIAAGRAEETVANAGADGAKAITVKRGVFKFANSGSDAVVAANVFGNCYVEDDQTVCKTATGKSVAGKVVEIASDGVWVEVGL
jgi:hypothetical protein